MRLPVVETNFTPVPSDKLEERIVFDTVLETDQVDEALELQAQTTPSLLRQHESTFHDTRYDSLQYRQSTRASAYALRGCVPNELEYLPISPC